MSYQCMNNLYSSHLASLVKLAGYIDAC